MAACLRQIICLSFCLQLMATKVTDCQQQRNIVYWINDVSFLSFSFLRRKGDMMKKRRKEEEIEKGDFRQPTQKVLLSYCRTWTKQYLIISQMRFKHKTRDEAIIFGVADLAETSSLVTFVRARHCGARQHNWPLFVIAAIFLSDDARRQLRYRCKTGNESYPLTACACDVWLLNYAWNNADWLTGD